MLDLSLLVPRPAEPARLDRFLAAALHGLSRRQVKGLLDAGQVRVDGRVERKAGRSLTPGQRLSVSLRPSWLPSPGLSPDAVLARGEGWLAIDKPAGLPTHRPDPTMHGVPEALVALGEAGGLRPVHRLDRDTSGVLLIATDDARAALLSTAFAERRVHKQYLAIVSPPPAEDRGEREDRVEGATMHLRWERRARSGDRAELAVWPTEGRTHQIRRQLAAMGSPIVGDLLHGIVLPGGAPRMALHCARLQVGAIDVSCAPPEGWRELLRPEATAAEPPAPSPPARKPRSPSLPSLRVSAATARVMAGGHPWVLPDRDTGDLSRAQPGDQALLVDPRGRELGVALLDPGREVVARLLSQEGRHALSEADFAGRAHKALRRRSALLDDPETDCHRLIAAEADGLPGLVVDRFGDLLLATRATEACAAFTGPVYAALRERFPDCALYEKDHIVDLRRRGPDREGDELPGRFLWGEGDDVDRLVREHGLRYRIEPLAGLTVGLYPDQRDNRARLGELMEPGAAVLNLFAHTGAFSVFAASRGARTAVSVDLAPRYCAWTEENLRRNALDPAQHPSIAAPSERWLAETEQRFDFVILDPPAFARGRKGNRGWNARRDYASLVEAATRVLGAGPCWLLCVVNLKGLPPHWLKEQVSEGARRAGRRVGEQRPAPPPPDFPTLRGFPEGRPFWGTLARIEAR